MTDILENGLEKSPGIRGPEFVLVVSMLVILMGLVFIVLVIPLQVPANPADESLAAVLKFRQESLTIIVTAFSAWIGAGAAYFFGRENLRAATQGMLQMRELPPRERLRQIQLKDLPPRPITWKVKVTDPLLTVYEKLTKDIPWWFVVITNEDGTLNTVIDEEAMWRYVNSLATNGQKPKEALTDQVLVKALLVFLGENKELDKKTRGVFVRATNNSTLGAVNDQMLDQGVFLAIITDDANKPVSYVSTDDIRKQFMKMS